MLEQALMELYSLQVFLTIASEKSFSRAAGKLLRTQPAISLSLQRLEQELGEKLIDRSGKDLILTDAGRTVLDFARRFQSLHQEMDNSIAELRDNSAGRLTIGANESTTLYLLKHIERYRELYPKVKVQVRRSYSSKLPNELLDGNLELGVISYDPGDERIKSKVIYTDALAFVVSPKHRLASRKTVSITELAAGKLHRAQRGVAVPGSGAARVPGAQSSAAHGRGDAHHRNHTQAGGAQHGRGFFAAHVRGAGDRAEAAVRSARERDARGAQDPADLSHAERVEPRG